MSTVKTRWMPTVKTRRVPTAQDATTAANRLMAAYEGIFAVLLHGSVARGDATADSDIDLVAVFTDFDYMSRMNLRFEIENRAAAWVPFPVQIHLTDLPEWSTRSTRVPSSFESNVMSGRIIVVAEGNADTNNAVWQKEQRSATDNLSAAINYLQYYVHYRLYVLQVHLQPAVQMAAEEKRDSFSFYNRMRWICENSSMAVEVAIKTLATLRDEHPITKKEMRNAGHNIRKCLNQLSPQYRIMMTKIITREGLDLASISHWCELVEHPGDVDVNGQIAEKQIDSYIITALLVTSAVISEFESVTPETNTHVTGTRRQWRLTAERYDTIDPRSGEPREVPLGITDKIKTLSLGVTPGQGWLFENPDL